MVTATEMPLPIPLHVLAKKVPAVSKLMVKRTRTENGRSASENIAKIWLGRQHHRNVENWLTEKYTETGAD